MRHRDHDFDDDEPYVVIEKGSGGLSGFFIGLAIGAGLALLFAPASGAETRQAIARGARRVKRTARDTVEVAATKVTETFESARQKVEEKIDRTRDAIETKKDQVRTAVREGRAAAQQAREELESRLAETKAAYNAGAKVARDARAENPRTQA